MKQFLQKHSVHLALLAVVAIFFSFGFYHLAKVETADEHLWKYARIGKYWQAFKEHNWKATYINDKPGITVALISGLGLIVEPEPQHNQAHTENSNPDLFRRYSPEKNEITNFHFRLPILIFSSLMLLAFFFLFQIIFSSKKIALLATSLIALNPILIGMTQIINPDSFFWVFGCLSMLSYLAFLKTKNRKLFYLCALTLGLALLSKYTAFILFSFFALAGLSQLIFQKQEEAQKVTWKNLAKIGLDLVILFVISNLIFALLLPAVIVKPELFFKGISQFLNFKIIAFGIFSVLIVIGLVLWEKNVIANIFKKISRYQKIILAVALSALSAFFLISLINLWSGEKIAPVNRLSDLGYTNEPKNFNFKPLMDRKNASPFESFQLIMMEGYPFVFSISPLIVLLIFFITFKSFKGKIKPQNKKILFVISGFVLIYILSTFVAKIVTNARYVIILYPAITIFAIAALDELFRSLKINLKKSFWAIWLILVFSGSLLLWQIKPFYFNYDSLLLPQSNSVHDTWGHGFYEAAQYLNSLENSKDLVVYSNSLPFCRFFNGHCLQSRRIDLNVVQPDYFIIFKRSVIKEKNHFILNNNPTPEKDFAYYLEKSKRDPVWELNINGRPENYIRIVQFEK